MLLSHSLPNHGGSDGRGMTASAQPVCFKRTHREASTMIPPRKSRNHAYASALPECRSERFHQARHDQWESPYALLAPRALAEGEVSIGLRQWIGDLVKPSRRGDRGGITFALRG